MFWLDKEGKIYHYPVVMNEKEAQLAIAKNKKINKKEKFDMRNFKGYEISEQ